MKFGYEKLFVTNLVANLAICFNINSKRLVPNGKGDDLVSRNFKNMI